MGKNQPKNETMLSEDELNAGNVPAVIDATSAQMLAKFRILQANDDRLAKDGGIFKDATPGQIYNTASLEVYHSLAVYLCHIRSAWIEYQGIDRNKTKMLNVMAFKPAGLKWRDKVGFVSEEGNMISESVMHYVVVQHADDTYEPGIIGFQRTSLRASRDWITAVRGRIYKGTDGKFYQKPLFSSIYYLQTAKTTQDNHSWFQWYIKAGDIVLQPGDDLFGLCVDFSHSAKMAQQAWGASKQETVDVAASDDDMPF